MTTCACAMIWPVKGHIVKNGNHAASRSVGHTSGVTSRCKNMRSTRHVLSNITVSPSGDDPQNIKHNLANNVLGKPL